MKIKVEKWITDEYGDTSYKIKSIEKCCNKLTNSMNISINNEYCEDDNYSDDNTYAVKLIRKEKETDPWEDYSQTNYYYEKIGFCPFCGEKIEIEFIGEVDKQEELKQLQQERDEIWKKCRKTDSKKKEQEFENKVHELDSKINDILTNDDFGMEEV
jgi:hypothetical protein